MARKATATSTLGKSETQQSISGLNQGTKRMASPDYRNKREDNRGGSGGSAEYNGQGSNRRRSSPPPRGVDRDRERRWEGPSSRRRPFSPPPPTSSWDRDDRPRAREPLPPLRAQEREEEKPRQVSIPPMEIYLLLLHLMVEFSTFFYPPFFKGLIYFTVDRSCISN